MKTVGIIGGLGPETTAEFYLELIFGCKQLGATQRPPILITSVPLELAIEREFLSTGSGSERYIPFLVKEAQRLEAAGADFLVMPCNSLHVFIQTIREAVGIPVLSIIEETTKHLVEAEVSRVGLLSTSATAKNKLYENELSKADISIVLPNSLERARIDKIIQRLVDGIHLNKDHECINNVIERLAENDIQAIALACTDLQILAPNSKRIEVFDTMKLLAESTVRHITGEA